MCDRPPQKSLLGGRGPRRRGRDRRTRDATRLLWAPRKGTPGRTRAGLSTHLSLRYHQLSLQRCLPRLLSTPPTSLETPVLRSLAMARQYFSARSPARLLMHPLQTRIHRRRRRSHSYMGHSPGRGPGASMRYGSKRGGYRHRCCCTSPSHI